MHQGKVFTIPQEAPLKPCLHRTFSSDFNATMRTFTETMGTFPILSPVQTAQKFSSQLLLPGPAVTFPSQLLPRKSYRVTFPETNSPVRTLHTERLGKSVHLVLHTAVGVRSCCTGHRACVFALSAALRHANFFFYRETGQNC